MPKLERRDWVPALCEDYIQQLAEDVSAISSHELTQKIEQLADENRQIHERDCINLNPATNVMNPRAEAILAAGLGSRPSLGYPGDKYEMGLEAIEKIEVIAAELAAQVFDARYAEIRVASGALANLYSFMATTKPGDTIIAPDAAIGGHVTHHEPGAAGLYGLNIERAWVSDEDYSVDLDDLRALAKKTKPKLITIGGSLNLFPHPVSDIRTIADEVGAWVLFDAAHQCGMFAGRTWPNPLSEGAHLMTMSTYKSLGGPAGGLIVTNDTTLAERLDKIAFPGLTANFDAAKSAALAITLNDWLVCGKDYASAMMETSTALANALKALGLQVYETARGMTSSHQFAIEAASWGGGQAASKKLRHANLLACGIGLPVASVEGDMNGLRIGTPELVRWGMTAGDMEELARLIADALKANDPETIAPAVSAMRQRFNDIHFTA